MLRQEQDTDYLKLLLHLDYFLKVKVPNNNNKLLSGPHLWLGHHKYKWGLVSKYVAKGEKNACRTLASMEGVQ